jgi:NitT/TauT family transport system substrate-binding protein
MPFAAKEMAEFMVDVGFLDKDKVPDLTKIFNDTFVKAHAKAA